MADTIAEGFARERAHRQLLIDLARHLFGWEWRQEWQAWCPPGWPSLEVNNAPSRDKRHGGAGYGSSGRRDGRGRPIIPDYCCDPKATEILWQWLHAQPEMQGVRFVPLPIPPDSLQGVTPWRCEIVVEPHWLITGAGDTHREALGYAVLALATPHAACVG